MRASIVAAMLSMIRRGSFAGVRTLIRRTTAPERSSSTNVITAGSRCTPTEKRLSAIRRSVTRGLPGPLMRRSASRMKPSPSSRRVMFVTVCADSPVAATSSVLLRPSSACRMASRMTD